MLEVALEALKAVVAREKQPDSAADLLVAPIPCAQCQN